MQWLFSCFPALRRDIFHVEPIMLEKTKLPENSGISNANILRQREA
jgi:hypothetical protein